MFDKTVAFKIFQVQVQLKDKHWYNASIVEIVDEDQISVRWYEVLCFIDDRFGLNPYSRNYITSQG